MEVLHRLLSAPSLAPPGNRQPYSRLTGRCGSTKRVPAALLRRSSSLAAPPSASIWVTLGLAAFGAGIMDDGRWKARSLDLCENLHVFHRCRLAPPNNQIPLCLLIVLREWRNRR
jgi:hypothetical protein